MFLAENVVRKALSPLEEARAVQAMLEQGYTADGAAQVLGWSSRRVTARARLLELPAVAQQLIGAGTIPVSAVDTMAAIQSVSPALCTLVAEVVAEAELEGNGGIGASLASDPGWVIGQALRHRPGEVFAAYLTTLDVGHVAELKLGKTATARLERAEQLHRQLDRYAYGPPRIAFGEADIDQARAAGVLLELGRAPIIVDRGGYRELAKQAIKRTVDDLERQAAEHAQARTQDRAAARATERTPFDVAQTEYRATQRAHAERAHGVNLDLGAALIDSLAAVDPGDLEVARFFAYGLLGPEPAQYSSAGDRVQAIAATGIRLVLDEHRTTETPTRKDGTPGKAKVTYTEPDQAITWLWRWVDGAKTAGELYGRVLVVFAAQHHAHQTCLPQAQRRPSVLPSSHGDRAKKAFAKLTKGVLPGTHRELIGAIERATRDHERHLTELRTTAHTNEPTSRPDPSDDARQTDNDREDTAE